MPQSVLVLGAPSKLTSYWLPTFDYLLGRQILFGVLEFRTVDYCRFR